MARIAKGEKVSRARSGRRNCCVVAFIPKGMSIVEVCGRDVADEVESGDVMVHNGHAFDRYLIRQQRESVATGKRLKDKYFTPLAGAFERQNPEAKREDE